MPLADAVETTPFIPIRVIEKIGSSTERERSIVLQKLAEIEKRVEVEGAPVDGVVVNAMNHDLPEEQVEGMKSYPLNDLFSSLHNSKCMLSPKDFIRIVMKKSDSDIPGLHEMPCALRSMFGEIAEGDSEDVVTDSSYTGKPEGSWSSLQGTTEDAKESISLEDGPVKKRVIIAISNGDGPNEKGASIRGSLSAESQVLAREYAKYQLSFATIPGNSNYLDRIILCNVAQ